MCYLSTLKSKGIKMKTSFTAEPIQKFSTLASAIEANLELKEGTIQDITPLKIYNENLPCNITPEQRKELSKYDSEYITAAHIAVGSFSADLFKKDKTLTAVLAQVAYGAPRDNINITVERSHTYTNHLAKNEADKEVIKHLSMTTNVEVKGARGISLKRIKDLMGEEYENSFKK